MKNLKIIIGIFLILTILIINIMPVVSYADDLGLGSLDSYRGSGNGSSQLKNRADKMLGVIQLIGTIVSVVMLVVIGIKYMLGSVEEKAEYKETLKPYIIGAFLLFTGTLVPQLIYKLSQNF